MLTVLVRGGLCNRMRATASAWALARICGRALCVQWNRSPDFNAGFESLFSVEGLPFEVREGRALSFAARAGVRAATTLKRLRGVSVLDEPATEPGVFRVESVMEIAPDRDVYIVTNSRLLDAPGMFGVFRPSEQVSARLEPLTPRLRRSVGVHVRRTDNRRASEVSTNARFIECMTLECERGEDTEFFVSSDCPRAVEDLRRTFGDRVWEYSKRAYSRDDPIALIDAVVDLAALSSCRRIIGSHWSSFTDTAAAWRGTPLVIAGHP